uniref:Uncharacterized protein n=1 Tax=Oncorhynchus kisutch TaxID=8019 RepID=A0A8C7FSB8_ONCKI
MGLRTIWNNYKVLIVMGTSLGLIHWGWYNVKSHPALHKNKQDYIDIHILQKGQHRLGYIVD